MRDRYTAPKTPLTAFLYWTFIYLFLMRYAKNQYHLTLPEIKDFNALGDVRYFRYFVKRYNRLADWYNSRVGRRCVQIRPLRRRENAESLQYLTHSRRMV
jgi:hypothetical protein